MFLSPSHISANSEIEDDEDFYSSSKKIETKRKAQSISQMIRKVENVIKNSETNNNQICSESKVKQFQETQFDPYQPQSFSQNLQPLPFTASNLPTLNPNHSQPIQPKIFLPSPSPRRFTCPVGYQGSSIKPTQIRMSEYTPVVSGEDNSTRISGFSSALISETARQPFTPVNTTYNSMSNDSQYITAQQLKGLLEEQLNLREKNIISQLSSCLKNMIIPEIKRQVIQDMDKKKSEIETLLKKFQGTVQEEMRSQVLDEKIASMKQSLDKQKIGRNQAEIFTQTLDQKIYAIEGRMEKLEEHSCGQIEMVEKIKSESRLAVMDLNHSRKQFQRIEEVVQSLSQSYINLEYQINKNFEEISKKFTSISLTDEIPFYLKKDVYQTDLMDNIKHNLIDGDIVLTRDVKEAQKPYSNGFDLQVNLQNVDSQQKQRFKESNNLIQSFSDYQIHSKHSKEGTNTFNLHKDLPSFYNPGRNIPDLVEESFRNKSNPGQIIKEELKPDIIRMSSNPLPTKYDTCSTGQQDQQEDSQNIIQNERLQTCDFELSTDINYVRKGLPQLFDFVESTYAQEDVKDGNIQHSYQYDEKGEVDSIRNESILIGEDDVTNMFSKRIKQSNVQNSIGNIRNEGFNQGEEIIQHNDQLGKIDLEEFIQNKINSSKNISMELSES